MPGRRRVPRLRDQDPLHVALVAVFVAMIPVVVIIVLALTHN